MLHMFIILYKTIINLKCIVIFHCRDKKYSKKSPKRDYREKSRERYSNGRRNHYSDRDKDYNYYKSYDKEKYSSSKHSSSRNGDRHHHKSSSRR